MFKILLAERHLLCRLCQPNELEWELKKKTGVQAKIWGCHSPPSPPLELPLAVLSDWELRCHSQPAVMEIHHSRNGLVQFGLQYYAIFCKLQHKWCWIEFWFSLFPIHVCEADTLYWKQSGFLYNLGIFYWGNHISSNCEHRHNWASFFAITVISHMHVSVAFKAA